MFKSTRIKLTSMLMVLTLMLGLFPNFASASSVRITTISNTTKASTTSDPKEYHHFYSSKGTVKVDFKVEKWVKTHKKKKLNVELQKSNGFWWTTQVSKSLTSTGSVSFSTSSGTGDYRLVVYDEAERTGYDKPPLFYAKSTKYSATIWGL
ncbi:hypothetical protein COI60_10060 [Bacillus toyonensis]|uniref:hypothetical protein n=1 Tax=Bacillus toyonensis TaxID=155322 RepID=UPI000BFDC0EA|nr:hypothetical protein [Bacillus toyonensis]PHG36386.1 hypothetical protein COI60_10060 [Bacillus toyonensis]